MTTTSSAPHPRRRIRPRGWGGSLLFAGLVLSVASALVGNATAGFTAATTNSGSSAGTGSLQIAAATGATTECATSVAAPTTSCAGYTVPSNTLAAGTTATSASTTLSATGSITPLTTTLTESSCGPIPLANAASTTDPMLIRNGVTDATSGPFTGGAGLTLDGSSGYADDVVSTSNPNNITEVVWFKSTSASGGTLLGFANTPALAPTGSDRMIWLDNAGKIVFGVAPLLESTITSPLAYNNGAWHMVAASVGTSGRLLYVDGTLVASSALVLGAQNYTGYWHVGWDASSTGWLDGPTDPYLAGSLADAAVFPTLSAAQIATLHNVTTQTAWNADAAGGGGVSAATNSWTLGDTATAVYTATPSWYTATPCALVDTTVAATATATSCLAPAGAGSCPAPSSTVTLASLSGSTLTFTGPTPTRTDTLKVSTARDPTNTVAANPNLLGLHLNLTEALVASAYAFRAELDWPATQNIVL